MLERSKSSRSQARRRALNAATTAVQRLEALEKRCSDDDSSQSSVAAAPIFASVHRTRHPGISAIKRDGIPTTTLMNSQGFQHQAMSNHQQQRPSYQQYQQQRRQQQQQQLLQQQQQQKQQHHLDNANNSHKFVKNGRNWLEQDARQQQQQQQQHSSSSTTIGATAVAVDSTPTAGTVVPANAKQSIAVSIPQPPFHQMNQPGIETVQNSANMQQITSTESIAATTTASKMSRIPMVQQQQQLQQPQQQQNFNQISKTAPHLLNDIYEKHLLSQTTFQEYELQQYHNHHQQQQQQFLASNRMTAVDVRPLGVSDFNLNNYAGNACMQPRQPQQQQHEQKLQQQFYQQQQHPGRSQKPLHFLKLPPPPATPPQSTAANEASQMHFHYTQQQQQQLHHHAKQLPPPSSPPPPAPLNHVYETIAERPPIPPPTASQPGGNKADTIDTATPPPPPLPPSRQLRKRLAAIGTNAIAASNGRSTKSNHKKGAGNVLAATTTTTAATSSSEHHNQRKHSMQKIGNNENFCFTIEDNQRQQLPLPSVAGVPPAYVAPPPAATVNVQHHKRQQQQHQHHHYNIQQRTKADGEHKSYVYQQLREHQQQQEKQQQQQQEKQQHQNHQNTKSAHVKREQQQQDQQIPQQQHQSNMREVPLGAVNASAPTTTKTNLNIATTASAAAVSANVVHAKAQHHAAPPLALLSVEEQLRQAGLLNNNSQASSGNMNFANNNNNNINNMNNRSGLCSALPIVFEEEAQPPPPPALPSSSTSSHGVNFKEMQPAAVIASAVDAAGVLTSINGGVGSTIGTAKLPYRHGKIEVSLETAQAMAAAAYYARAAQKLAQSGGTRSSSTRSADMTSAMTRNGGFCGALQRAPPPMPPGLARRLANKENYGLGKVKVMLRVADTNNDADSPHFMTVDKKKRQVTLTDPTAANSVAASTSQERGPMVAAPKMFAFDSLFTAEDQQSDVCSSALSEVIPAVLEGSDGCLLTIGYPSSGQSKTMLGSVNPPTDLGAIPCAISWLYKGINERRQKSGSRFSVRVSALGVSATKPDSSSKDLLAAHATESDDSPGVYLRDDFLGGPTELRAPTAERAALFLDAALAGRPQGGLEPAMIFTLHVYQYSLSRKGGVAGGRSRLHLIDLGGCANRNGGLPLSGIGNVLLAILSGQRHPPNKDHPLTPLLKDCLAPLTCHVAIMAHVMHTQSHTDALTTIQLASRIHRMRRRKHRFPLQADKTAAVLAATINGGHQSTGSSAGSGADPSSSELSADTVIYMGPSDEATDGEHPPVYLPSLSCGDNRGVMSKALKGSGIEKQQPQATAKVTSSSKKPTAQKAPQSPVTTSRTGSLKRGHANSPTPQQQQHSQLPQPTAITTATEQPQFFSPSHSLKTMPHSASSPKIVAGSLRHSGVALMSSKGSNVPSPKGSPLRRPGVGVTAVTEQQIAATNDCPGSPMRKITEEQWIDGPRVSRAKVAEARHLLREVNHVKQCETWIDGPKSQSSRSLTAGNLPGTASQVQGYGFMDSHKKTMIRQWVENQTSQVFQSSSAACSPTHQSRVEQQAQHIRSINYHMAQLKQKSLDATTDEFYMAATQTLQSHQLLADQQSLRSSQLELVHPIGAGLTTAMSTTNASAPAEIRRHNAQQLQNTATSNHSHRDETDLHSERSLHSHSIGGYGTISHNLPVSDAVQQSERNQADCDEDQDSGPSEVPPALPLIEPLGSREISHESLHRILSRHVSRESLYQQQQQQQELRRQDDYQQQQRTPSHHYSQHSMGMSDCGLQVTEEEIARTMGSEHPLSALSHCDNMSIVSSFNMAGDAFSDCAMGERTRNQFDQLARLREIFTSQLAMAEVTPVFRSGCDVGSVYSEPAYRFNTGPGSVCSEPPYRPPSPRQPSRSPSQSSLPSLNGIMQIAGMEQYASLRHPDGASDPNLPKLEKPFVLEHEDINEVDEKAALLSPTKRPSQEHDARATPPLKHLSTATLAITTQNQLPLLPLNTGSCEAYDSGHDSSTPRTSKHSGISRRAESGYHSVATARDSDESSFTSGLSKDHHNRITLQVQKKKRQDKGLCTWLMNPFTCTYPETEGEISDF